MIPWKKVALVTVTGLILAGPAVGCADGEAGDAPAATPETDLRETPSGEDLRPGRSAEYAGPVLDLPPMEERAEEGAPEPHETERDWAIARGTLEWALRQRLDMLPVGEAAGIIGSTFVGADYIPGTLELPGPEDLVVNLRAFDCVTFVEHVLVLARLVTGVAEGGSAGEAAGAQAPSFAERLLDDEEAFRAAYRAELTALRYRGGVIDGYPSRLHYFTEWMDHAEAAGRLVDITGELGGIPDDRRIHFMSSNPDAYRQLDEEPALIDEIREVEARLSAGERLFIPQERIAEVEDQIRTGDVIAAVSTVDGLDIAHTGFAIQHAGRLHLLHAPLVGESVEISERPLADRIQRISGQNGIRVARPR
jgi:hypothetical protein